MTTLRRGLVRSILMATVVVAASVVLVVPAATVGAADIAAVTCDPVAATDTAPEQVLASFEPQNPERIIDTRDGTGGVDEPLDAGCTLMVDMSTFGPGDVSAFALSVTVVADEQGFFTAFPCAGGQPGTSSVNARPGFPTPNLVVATPDAAGMICLFSNRGGEVVIDVSGWWSAGSNRFTPVDPVRAYDTRTLDEPVKLPGEAIRDVEVGGLFIPDDAVSVHINLAAVDPDERGFLVAYPCGTFPPLASNLNFMAGERRAVAAIVKVGDADAAAAGRICVTGNVATHFIIDVTGYDAPQSATSPDLVLQPLADTRVVDTRDGELPGEPFEQGTLQRFELASVVERPDDVTAAVLNVTAVQADRAAFASVYPCQPGTPTTSSLNYDLGQTANLVVTSLALGAEFCVYTNSDVHIIVDLVGVVRGPADALVHQLSFIRAGGDLLPLHQNLSTAAGDYTFTCGTAELATLRLGVALGASAAVDGVPVEAGDPADPGVPVLLEPDRLIEVSVARGSLVEQYFIRCLPLDFPDVDVERTGTAAPGWYLTEVNSNATVDDPFIIVFDERGVPIWYKRMDKRLIDAKLDSAGNILLAEPEFGFGVSTTLGHRIYDLDGQLLDVQQTPDTALFPVDHHDYAEIPAGVSGQARAMLSYPLVAGADLTSLVLPTEPSNRPCAPGDPLDPEGTSVIRPSGAFVDGTIVEMVDDSDPAPWVWNASEHFGFDESTYALCFDRYDDQNPVLDMVGDPTGEFLGEVDPFHLNSMQRIADTGCEPLCDYVVSGRHLDAVFRVDRDSRDPDGPGPLPDATGYVDWILGGTEGQPNLNGAPRLTIVDDPLGGPLRPHDARLHGDIVTMHDNRTGTSDPARFVAYQLDLSDPDPTLWTATLIRQIDSPLGQPSGAFGSARAADDGSVLVAWGQIQPMFVEYGPDDAPVLQIGLNPGHAAYRIVKYAPETFDIDVLRAAAGGDLAEPLTI
ncbi:MAG: hypothetical protein AB8G14_04465 [Ilumatobacter sp.]